VSEPDLSAADIERMQTPLWEQAKVAINDGRTDDAVVLIDRAVEQWSGLKDYSINWITSLLTFVADEKEIRERSTDIDSEPVCHSLLLLHAIGIHDENPRPSGKAVPPAARRTIHLGIRRGRRRLVGFKQTLLFQPQRIEYFIVPKYVAPRPASLLNDQAR
jgi:hypothetical protein